MIKMAYEFDNNKYDSFIKTLRSMDDTVDILFAIFNYFKVNVSYNYDELQVVKFQRAEDDRLLAIRDLSFQNRTNNSSEFKEKLMQLLDEAFMNIEGRPLSNKNKKEWFKNYGMVIYHEAKPSRGNSGFKISGNNAYDSVIHLEVNNYPPVYEDDLLKEGVCADYSLFVKRICDEIDIPCLIVRGKGTTGHAWNLIFIKERNMWVNFDMTMVRFYLDNWSQVYGEPEKWICATNEEMFKMQPSRLIYEIINPKYGTIFNSTIGAENQSELNEFLLNLKPEETLKR